MKYQDFYNDSLNDRELFWREQAQSIRWFDFPNKILTQNEQGFYRWYEGGKLNTCYLALDYHIENGRGEQTAIIYDSPVTDMKLKLTYSELRDKVAKFAGVLKGLGVAKGDRVIIYMPMIPETVVAMLACARLGAVHSVVFGGFAAHELAIRIDKVGPVASFKRAVIAARLPKTRSGKILRKAMRYIADGQDFAMPSTIEDPMVLDEIRHLMEKSGIGVAFG